MHGPRAVAIVVRRRQVLVIKRHYRGHEYAVLPGGSVEPGESRGGRDCRGRSWRSAARTTASSCCGPGGDELDSLGLHPQHLRGDLPRLLDL